MKTASVWSRMFDRRAHDPDRNMLLQSCGFFNGLILGLCDYESSVRVRFETLVEKMEAEIDLREENCLRKIQKVLEIYNLK